MSSGERPIRLVIQHIGVGNYRVIVYPAVKGREALRFSSREEMLERICAAIPGFDASEVKASGAGTEIVFAGNVTVTDAKIAKLYGS